MKARTAPVLVTGGAGFLGSYVVRALADKDVPSVAFDLVDAGPEARFVTGDADVRYHFGDVRDPKALAEVMTIYRPWAVMHVASVVDPVRLATDPRTALDINVGGIVNVLEQCRRHEIAKVVRFSSVSVLPRIITEPILVDHPVLLADQGPAGGFYGASKVAGEAFCMAANAGLGMDCRIVRPSAVYGLGMQWPMSIKPLVEGAVRGQDVHLEHGTTVPRDYTHAEDVASLAVATLYAPDYADRIYYGATGSDLTTPIQLAALLRQIVPGARLTLEDNVIDDDERESSYRGRLSIENAVNQLDWTPHWANIENGLRHYVDQLREFEVGIRSQHK